MAYYGIGFACGNLERHADAITAYKQAVAIKPDYPEAYYNMGFACGRLKQNAPAIAAYEKVVALEQKGEIADLAREAIRRLRRQ